MVKWVIEKIPVKIITVDIASNMNITIHISRGFKTGMFKINIRIRYICAFLKIFYIRNFGLKTHSPQCMPTTSLR